MDASLDKSTPATTTTVATPARVPVPPCVVAVRKLIASCLPGKLSIEDVQRFWLALLRIEHPMSDKMLQAIAVDASRRLGLKPIEVNTWCLGDLQEETHEDRIKVPRGSMLDAVKAMIGFVAAVRGHAETCCPNATRVYLWRDCFFPMVLDSLQPPIGNKDAVRGVVVSRSTIGEDFYYNKLNKSPDTSVQGMIAAAAAAAYKSRKRFIAHLIGSIRARCEAEEPFRFACHQLINHLVRYKALKWSERDGFPIQQVMFIDTGYKTFPAFLTALVHVICGPSVTVEMFYHTVSADLSFLPCVNVKGAGEDPMVSLMNDIGGYASFLKSGSTLNARGELSVTYGNKNRLRDSIMFGLLLANIVRSIQEMAEPP
jgi:hypothetical protein